MDLTVAIPSRGRNGLLMRLLDALSNQTIDDHRFEVLVGLDGETSPGSHTRVGFLELPHRGPAATRNALVDEARCERILFLNDDVIPDAKLLEYHIRAHEELHSNDMVLGSAPWLIPSEDTLFDRLIRETSLVFFYNAMNETERGRDWGFRHAWTLNLSLRTELARQVRFEERLPRAMFEDLEWAYRLAQAFGSRVLYRPEATVTHDHRYTPRGYLDRERQLGAQAIALAEINPSCAAAVFRRDVREPEFVRQCKRECAQEGEVALVLEREFEDLARRSPDSKSEIEALYQRFLPLKRYWWRQGLVEEAVRVGLISTLAA